MNDQHPHAGYVADDTYSTGSFATDPLFGALPGHDGTDTYGNGYPADHSGQYDTTQWASASQQWDTTGYVEYAEYTGQWDATAWNEANAQAHRADQAAAQFTAAPYGAGAPYDATGQWDTTGRWDAPAFDTGAHDATAWNHAPATETLSVPEQYDYAAEEDPLPEPEPLAQSAPGPHPDSEFRAEPGFPAGTTPDSDSVLDATPVAAPRRAAGGRSRRRTPAKRSALLTVVVPSACVMGVAGIAAASVGGLTGGTGEKRSEDKTVAAADPASVQPVAANSALDTQLAALSADARDFGDRASRTQERIDLKARQEEERKRREQEAARREALRPKFALPVALHQLSARYGQAGVNWMSLHTGIDFPVQYGTPVMAATDGTVRTQWNSAYGNMAIVTAKDGTETWYCHLSTTKIRSGEVKAGDVIAYSGNSGNSTGPHLHFEVRPGGGVAIDPLPWLRSHGLDPTQ